MKFHECCVIFLENLVNNHINLFKILGETAKVIGYGHLGDGNLHLNISAPRYDDMVISVA